MAAADEETEDEGDMGGLGDSDAHARRRSEACENDGGIIIAIKLFSCTADEDESNDCAAATAAA